MVVVTHQAEKIWTYDRTTVHDATFNMRDQLYRGHAHATALSSSPVVSALGSDPGSSPGRGKTLCPWDVRGKKMRAPLLGLAKSIYYFTYNSLTPTHIMGYSRSCFTSGSNSGGGDGISTS